MSLEAKIQELTEAVTTLTGALATLTTQTLVAGKGAGRLSTEETTTMAKEAIAKETPADIKKREAKEKRDAKRQAAQEAETAAAKATKVVEDADDGLEVEVVEVVEDEVVEITNEVLKKVALFLIKSGKKPEWLAALAATGVAKLTLVPMGDRPALLEVLEGIAGMPHGEI